MVDSPESQRGTPEPILKTFLKQIMEIGNIIVSKYQSKRTPQEARVDALIYATSLLSWYKVVALINPNLDKEEIEYSNKLAIQWKDAIEGAKNNDWFAMKTTLQNYARDASSDAAIHETLRETNPQVTSGDESEREADAFVNLINSL